MHVGVVKALMRQRRSGGQGQSGPSHQTISAASKSWFCLPFLTQVFHPSCCRAFGVFQQQQPRRTWLRTIELDLRPRNLGLNTAWMRAQDRSKWRQLVETAMLTDGRATRWWWWWWHLSVSASHVKYTTNSDPEMAVAQNVALVLGQLPPNLSKLPLSAGGGIYPQFRNHWSKPLSYSSCVYWTSAGAHARGDTGVLPQWLHDRPQLTIL